MVRTAVADFAEHRDCLDPGQHRKRRDGACRAERPYRAEAREPCGEAGLDAFADVQSERHAFVGVELDRGVARATEHLAVEFAAGAVEKCSMDPARLISPDVAKERNHAAHRRAVEFECRMKPDHVAGNVVRKRETA